jgi:HK97 family phage prohead protease
MEREYRVASATWPDDDFEIRATSDGLNFRGYAAVFDKWSEDLGGFREKIAPGAFTKTLAERGRSNRNPIKMFLNHDWDVVLASTYVPKGGEPTMRLSEDERGLLVDADLPDNEWGRPVRDAIRRGDISTMSFGFNVAVVNGKPQDEWNANKTERVLRENKLWEVSPVTAWPAYADTTASVRHLADLVGEEPDAIEAAVREFLSTSTELTDETRRLVRTLMEARTPKPTIDTETVAFVEEMLLRRRDLDAYLT